MKLLYFFFPENMKKILGFTSKFRSSQVTQNTGIFYFPSAVLKIFGLSLPLVLYFVYTSSKGSGKTAHMCSLA